MSTAYELAHGNERLQALIEFAHREGWQIRRTSDGRIIFSNSGESDVLHQYDGKYRTCCRGKPSCLKSFSRT